MVTAHDFVYGIKRGCDPALENYYSDVIGPLIAGCDVQAAQVRALDDTTLEIHMQNPAGYFPAVAVLPILRAVPPELITARDHWTDLGVILTNGPFMLDDWHPNVRYGFRRNPFLPDDLRGPGNVEVVRIAVVDYNVTAFTLYQTQDVDVSPIAYWAFKDTLADPAYSDQLFSYSDQAVFVIAFAYAQEPFDNVHVRRAFSAAIDRNLFVEEIRQQRGYGMIHFAPPDLSGALPLDEVGMGYDPAYARAELALAGYPNCEGFPEVVMYAYQGAGPWMEFLASNLREVLGCDPELFIIEQEEFAVLIDPPYPEPGWIPSDWPPVFTLGEGVDYPDVQSVFDTFPPCGADISPNPEDRRYTWLFWMNWTFIQRPCTEADTLLAQAAAEPDPQIRADLYRQIEELWFGPEGEFPVIPLFTRRNYMLHQPWITGPFDTDWTPWGPHYDWYTIDAVAQN
jgi:oligopeptide transport system substrate-binding protein